LHNTIVDRDTEIKNLQSVKDAEIKNLKSVNDAEIEKLKTEVSDLQKLVPAPKVVKKTTVKTEEKPVEISATETNKTRVEVGGTF
jgi:hypothetical protein